MIATQARSFVDSNIWLYAFISGQDASKSAKARKLLFTSKDRLVISTQVISEVCVNMLRKAGTDEKKLRSLIHSFYTRYQVIPFKETIYLSASNLRQSYSFSYWDSLIISAALAADVNNLYSEDMQDGLIVDSRLTIINPFRV